jgi:predicted phosphoribosyltransferase
MALFDDGYKLRIVEGSIQFRDRRKAGKALARALQAYANRPDAAVLALPHGGAPVASVGNG